MNGVAEPTFRVGAEKRLEDMVMGRCAKIKSLLMQR
jgi:hypothetical protein